MSDKIKRQHGNRAANRRTVTALILAAGSGQRIGGKAKAFLAKDGRTLLAHAVDAVRPFASEVLVGVRSEDLENARKFVRSPARVMEGGTTRQETLSILLSHASNRFVMVHEVARPFTSPGDFQRVLAAGMEFGAAVLYCPVQSPDSLALIEGGKLETAIPRSRVVALQTPHVYHAEILRDADRRARQEGWTEEGTAVLVHRAGYCVRLVPGSAENIKITYREDLSTLRRTTRRKR